MRPPLPHLTSALLVVALAAPPATAQTVDPTIAEDGERVGPLEEVLDGPGGFVQGSLKAVLVGGPTGGFLPPDGLDTPFAYDDLAEAGAVAGSGTLLALFASASANLYLGWIAVDLHNRYRSAVMQLTDAAALGM